MSDVDRSRPALRRRMLTQPFSYLTDHFLLELMSDGARFIWPCSYAEIVIMHQETGRYEFSDEFSMRLSNLRSFALTKDFLDRHPELRGDAAQLEPSVTTYQLSEANIAETIFWAKLREARHKKNERNVAQAEPPDVEQVEVPITAGEERSPQSVGVDVLGILDANVKHRILAEDFQQ